MKRKKPDRGEPSGFAYQCTTCWKIYVKPNTDEFDTTGCKECGHTDAIFIGNRYPRKKAVK